MVNGLEKITAELILKAIKWSNILHHLNKKQVKCEY